MTIRIVFLTEEYESSGTLLVFDKHAAFRVLVRMHAHIL